MKLIKSETKDIGAIIKIIKQAQSYLKDQNISQWQNNYPNEDNIKEDIRKDSSYILVHGEDIIGTVALSFDGEPTYDYIYKGTWLTNNEYGVIHRIAVDSELKGKNIGKVILDELEKICINKKVYSLKVDTHRKNTSMINFLTKNGFIYTRIIYISDGSERFAYEKILK